MNYVEFLMSPLNRSVRQKSFHLPLYSKCGKYHYDGLLEVDEKDNPYVRVALPDSFVGPIDTFLLETKMEPYTFFEYVSTQNKSFNLDILLADFKSKINNRAVLCHEAIKLYISKFGEDELETAIDEHEAFIKQLKSTVAAMLGIKEKPEPGKLTIVKNDLH
jgi:hypothetical protein